MPIYLTRNYEKSILKSITCSDGRRPLLGRVCYVPPSPCFITQRKWTHRVTPGFSRTQPTTETQPTAPELGLANFQETQSPHLIRAGPLLPLFSLHHLQDSSRHLTSASGPQQSLQKAQVSKDRT